LRLSQQKRFHSQHGSCYVLQKATSAWASQRSHVFLCGFAANVFANPLPFAVKPCVHMWFRCEPLCEPFAFRSEAMYSYMVSLRTSVRTLCLSQRSVSCSHFFEHRWFGRVVRWELPHFTNYFPIPCHFPCRADSSCIWQVMGSRVGGPRMPVRRHGCTPLGPQLSSGQNRLRSRNKNG
jgi:hypothetical protein